MATSKAYAVAVGLRLTQFREAKWPGREATWYAKQAGIGKTTYENYEKGRRVIPPQMAIKLKREHNITLEWIYDADDHGLERGVVDRLRSST